MFTQSCFIRNANKDLIYNIMALGYKPMYMTWRNNIEGNNLVLEYNTWHFTDSDNHPNSIDCGTNEELFLAIAALRDDTDKYQWFVLDTHLSFNPNANCIEYSKGNFIKCGRDKWNVDFNEDGTPCEFSSKNIPAHKATVNELIEHFKDR